MREAPSPDDDLDDDPEDRRRVLHRTAQSVGYLVRRGFARELRQRLTLPEAALWQWLRYQQTGGRGWRREHIVGRFIVDFVHLGARLAVELDGGYHDEPEQRARDRARDAWLTEEGWLVVRYRNKEVLDGAAGVAAAVGVVVEERGEHS